MKVLVIENQFTQFKLLFGFLSESKCQIYPSFEEYVYFIDLVRIYLDHRYDVNTRVLVFDKIKKIILHEGPDIIIVDHILVGNHKGKTGVDLVHDLPNEFDKISFLFLSRSSSFQYETRKKLQQLTKIYIWLLKGYEGKVKLSTQYYQNEIEPVLLKLYYGEVNFNVLDSEDLIASNRKVFEKIIQFQFRQPLANLNKCLVKIEEWFENFQKEEYFLAYEILKNIRFITKTDETKFLKPLADKVNNLKTDTNRVFLIAADTSGAGSGTIYMYLLDQMLNGEILPNKNLPSDLTQNDAVVFLDDIIGTGKTALEFYADLPDKKCNCMFYFSALVGIQKSIIELKKTYKDVFVGEELADRFDVFDENSTLNLGTKRKSLKAFAEKYGKLLWPAHPFGYEGSQALVAFQHNTPNNTLPIIWAGPDAAETKNSERGPGWSPLFKRKKKKD